MDTKERQHSRLTLDLDPKVHTQIKMAAARGRMSMREYITTAVVRRLEEEKGALKAS